MIRNALKRFNDIANNLLFRSKSISSAEQWNVGTTIELKQIEKPNLFCHELYVKPNSIIVVLDDDFSIHDAWNERFSNTEYVKLQHFYNSSDLSEYIKNNLSQVTYYLINYELIANNKDGLDFIEELGINQKAILVANYFEDAQIRDRCNRLAIKIILKSHIPYIQIIQLPIKDVEDRIVFIDDDEIMRTAWTLVAESVGKKISTYSSFESFIREMITYSKNTTIYIDSELGNNIKGETCAKYLFENGFTTIHLATGHSPDQFESMPWIKSIIGKDPLLVL